MSCYKYIPKTKNFALLSKYSSKLRKDTTFVIIIKTVFLYALALNM